MKRLCFAGVGVLVAGSLVAAPLLAQPEPPREGPQLLEIPAGDYINFVFAFAGGAPGKILRVSIEANTSRDELTLLVPSGETVVVPLASGTKTWRALRPMLVRLDQPTRLVYGSGMTAEGPITFRPAHN